MSSADTFHIVTFGGKKPHARSTECFSSYQDWSIQSVCYILWDVTALDQLNTLSAYYYVCVSLNWLPQCCKLSKWPLCLYGMPRVNADRLYVWDLCAAEQLARPSGHRWPLWSGLLAGHGADLSKSRTVSLKLHRLPVLLKFPIYHGLTLYVALCTS